MCSVQSHSTGVVCLGSNQCSSNIIVGNILQFYLFWPCISEVLRRFQILALNVGITRKRTKGRVITSHGFIISTLY